MVTDLSKQSVVPNDPYGQLRQQPVYSLKQAAVLLGNLSERTMRKLLANGDLPYTKIGGLIRIRAVDLEAFVAMLPTNPPLRLKPARKVKAPA